MRAFLVEYWGSRYENYRLQDGWIVPQGELEPPRLVDLAYEDKERQQAYLEFANAQNAEKALEFTRAYGLLTRENAIRVADFLEEARRFRQLVRLWQAAADGDNTAMGKWLAGEHSDKVRAENLPPIEERYLAFYATDVILLPRLTEAMRGISLTIGRKRNFEKDEPIVMRIVAPDLLTALYVTFAFDVARGKKTGVCPVCGDLFSGRETKKFCTERCARIDAQRNYRKRLKERFFTTTVLQPGGNLM